MPARTSKATTTTGITTAIAVVPAVLRPPPLELLALPVLREAEPEVDDDDVV
jgi:hypothetical protein